MHLTKPQIDDLKARLDLREVIETAIDLKRQGKYFVGRCPFHSNGKERTPSLVVNPAAGLWNCRGGCTTSADPKSGVNGKSGGDAITFWMKLTGQSFPAACEDLAQRFSIPLGKNGDGENGNGHNGDGKNGSHSSVAAAVATASSYFSLGQSAAPRALLFSRAVEEWTRQLATNLSAQGWLESRGLLTKDLWRVFRLGYSSGSLADLSGTEASEARQHLKALGLLSEDGKETMKGRIVFPLLSLDDLPVNVYGRSLKNELEPHHRFNRGELVGLFNAGAAKRSKELLLVESVICAASLCEARVTNAVPLYGAHGPTDDLVALMQRHEVRSVVVALDSDETGRKAAPKLVEDLRALGLNARAIEWPEKDPNEVLVKHGAEKLGEITAKLLAAPVARDVLSSRATQSIAPLLTDDVAAEVTTPSSEKSEGASVREEKPEAPSTGASAAPPPSSSSSDLVPADVLAGETLTLPLGERLWDVLWLESPSAAQVRARVKVFVGESAQGPAFLDTLNLALSRAREGFARRAAALALPESATSSETQRLARLIEADLIRLAELGEARRKLADEKPADPAAMSEERRARALAYARSSELLPLIATDIGAAGYVGEATVKLLGYLVAISRKLPDALSMVILSSSGSGKSALAEVLEKMTPDEDLLVVTRFTASSLYWMGKDVLKRKFVSIEERGGSQEADYSIRALQSKKKVTMMAPVKDQATGKLETKLFEVEGPASFLESTTESQIHHENATRCFEVRLDESAEQTRRIQDAQRRSKTREGQKERLLAAEIASVHQDLQRLLKPIRVVIPFAAEIEFPSDSIRTRRDNPRFLNLVEALAFLHQYQRPLSLFSTGERAGRGIEDLADDELPDYRVEATLDDYASAYDLASDLLYETLSDLKKPLRLFLAKVKELAASEAKKSGAALTEVSLLSREIREGTDLPQHTVKRYLGELLELEYLAATKGSRGASYAYRLVDMPEKKAGLIPGLLPPARLLEKLVMKKERRQ